MQCAAFLQVLWSWSEFAEPLQCLEWQWNYLDEVDSWQQFQAKQRWNYLDEVDSWQQWNYLDDDWGHDDAHEASIQPFMPFYKKTYLYSLVIGLYDICGSFYWWLFEHYYGAFVVLNIFLWRFQSRLTWHVEAYVMAVWEGGKLWLQAIWRFCRGQQESTYELLHRRLVAEGYVDGDSLWTDYWIEPCGSRIVTGLWTQIDGRTYQQLREKALPHVIYTTDEFGKHWERLLHGPSACSRKRIKTPPCAHEPLRAISEPWTQSPEDEARGLAIPDGALDA